MIPIDKSLFSDLDIRLDDYCTCGRTTAAYHCPHCGSTDVRVCSRESKLATVLLPNGVRRKVYVLKCRCCAKMFQENDCFHACKAFAVAWRSETKVAEQISEQLAPTGGTIPDSMRPAMVAIAKKYPRFKQTIQDKLAAQGPGLLERVDLDRGVTTAPKILNAQDDPTLAKLFEPPVLDNGPVDPEEETKS